MSSAGHNRPRAPAQQRAGPRGRKLDGSPAWWKAITVGMQGRRLMARGRPPLRAEDAKALTLLMSPAADEFTIALDRCGWMIVPQPQFGDRRWFMNYPSDACPEWADKHVPEELHGLRGAS